MAAVATLAAGRNSYAQTLKQGMAAATKEIKELKEFKDKEIKEGKDKEKEFTEKDFKEVKDKELMEFKEKHAMRVDLLSDFKREVSRRYGVLREDTFYSNRAYFLVDRQGIVRWVHVEDKSGQRRENREILDRIASLG